MVSEPINDLVPERLEFLNDQRFAEGNPNIVHHQAAIAEILD
jgi:hypothetical protein